jgi:hypothetical protein
MLKAGRWLDAVPLLPVLVVALLLGLAPFVPEPHLVEKIRMLVNGTLNRPIDIFDLAYHSLPVLLLLAKLIRGRVTMSGDKSGNK